MLTFGRLTENNSLNNGSLKSETPQVNKTKRKLGLRNPNIQQHAPIQPEIKQCSKEPVSEKLFEEACENHHTYEDKDDYGDLHMRLANINSLLDGVLSLSCMNASSDCTEFFSEEGGDGFDPSSFEIPDSEFNTMFSCLG
ncbi:hypothetical protein KSF78_0005147 [Schistosoma japonicum]|nr:hypothetical protein KSF78_0005147 [Schistosoma japonicum]KAH8877188.1 hypothetical protein KSF78_0005147 [Schistosoma japonicum]KAH8877189.1 hypothetical protein KSF78_0005147 [Schistosoma japonicum]KAH8877191.1 hypothetical protein KSF78_0005147 [Schistosoma japonicum]